MLSPFSTLETKPLDISQSITINLLIRRPDCLKDYADGIVDGEHNNILSHEEFDQQFGATPEDIQIVTDYALLNGLTIVDAHSGSRTIKVSGTVGQFNSIFNITLTEYTTEDRSYFDYTGMLKIPDEIANVVEYIIGLSTKKRFVNHVKFFQEGSSPLSTLHPNLKTVTPQQVATAYNFPAGSGAGQCIGILELGGGYLSSDVRSSFSAMGLSPPTIVDVLVSGGINSPANDNASFENILDIVCAGGVAPSAKIAMYFAPNTSQGFIDGIAAAIHDTTNNPSVLSVSWASYEQYEDILYINAFEDMLHSAVVKGITVLFAAGDEGSETFMYYGNNQELLPATGYPASSPYVLACGGTSLELNTGTNTIAAEYVWNEDRKSVV